MFGALFFALCAIIPPTFGAFERFSQASYWSAAKIFVTGGNPYDPKQLFDVFYQANGNNVQLELVWGLPPIFSLISLYSHFTFEQFLIVQSKISIVFFILSIAALHFTFRSRNEAEFSKYATLLVALQCIFIASFYPFYLALLVNPVAAMLLFSLSLFFFILKKFPEGFFRYFFAGAALSISAVKPQALYLLYVLVLYGALLSRTRRIIAFGLITGLIIISLIPLHRNGMLYQQYRDALPTFPLNYFTPTIGSWLRALLFPSWNFILFAVPMISSIAAAAFLSRRHSQGSAISFDPIIIPLSMATTAYIWTSDWIVILPAALWCFAALRKLDCSETRVRVRALILASALALCNIFLFMGPTDFRYTIWYPFAISVCMLYAKYLLRSSNVS